MYVGNNLFFLRVAIIKHLVLQDTCTALLVYKSSRTSSVYRISVFANDPESALYSMQLPLP